MLCIVTAESRQPAKVVALPPRCPGCGKAIRSTHDTIRPVWPALLWHAACWWAQGYYGRPAS